MRSTSKLRLITTTTLAPLLLALTACGAQFDSAAKRPDFNRLASLDQGAQPQDSRDGSDAGRAQGSNNQQDSKSRGVDYELGLEAATEESSTPAPGSSSPGMKSTPAEQAAAIARSCPQVDPKVIEQLIASGQPFEVECELEIEVGPDRD